jgi:hypothetical protein
LYLHEAVVENASDNTVKELEVAHGLYRNVVNANGGSNAREVLQIWVQVTQPKFSPRERNSGVSV